MTTITNYDKTVTKHNGLLQVRTRNVSYSVACVTSYRGLTKAPALDMSVVCETHI